MGDLSMFGLFKKRATPGEFGHGVVHLALDWLTADAGRSLATRFENFDASRGWTNFLASEGVSMETQKLYFRLFTHSAVQGVCTQFEEGMRREITEGAIGGFRTKPDGYDFKATYITLEEIYRGEYKFNEKLVPLKNLEAKIHFLPNPNVGVLNAKYLIESFIIPHMKNSGAFIDDFQGYSSTVCVAVGLVQRAMNQLSKSVTVS